MKRTELRRTEGLRADPEKTRAFLRRGRKPLARSSVPTASSPAVSRPRKPLRAVSPTKRPAPPEGPLTAMSEKWTSAFSELLDTDWLRDQYETAGRSLASIGLELGCSSSLVRRWVLRHGISLRKTGERPWADITGSRFGLLVAEKEVDRGHRNERRWLCVCDCGRTVIVERSALVSKHSQSCGCRRDEESTKRLYDANLQHGHTVGGPSPTYRSWLAMVRRCSNPRAHNWRHYGGRGITVCDRWLGTDGFASFLADLGERPPNTSLDRIDHDGNYEPENCRWADRFTQARNRRKPKRREVEGPLTPYSWRKLVHANCYGRCIVTGTSVSLTADRYTWQAHHPLPKRLLPPERRWDPRNGVVLLRRVHERHETRTTVIPLEALPPSVMEFARELGSPYVEALLRAHPPAADPRRLRRKVYE